MNENIYEQAEKAIKNGWFVRTGTRWSGSVQVHTVLRIEQGNIIVKIYDHAYPCEVAWTPEDWRKYVSENGDGLLEEVGMYDFVPVGNPASGTIRWAHRNPSACGQQLYDAEQELEKLKKEIEKLKRGVTEK